MKRNNSFRTTFWMGLLVMMMIVSILWLIVINVFHFVSPKLVSEKKVEVSIETEQKSEYVEPIKTHDTIYIEKPIVKPFDTPKSYIQPKPKVTLPISEKEDTTKINDTIK